jgi:hypothetical protein
MKRLIWLLALAPTAVLASPEYLGVYLKGQRIGYASYTGVDEPGGGRRNVSTLVLRTRMLGSDLDMRSTTTTWLSAKGEPRRMRFVTESGGRSQIVDAKFQDGRIIASVLNNGERSSRTLIPPTGAKVLDDGTGYLLTGGAQVGKSVTFYVLDPTTVTLVKNEAVFDGEVRVLVRGTEAKAQAITVRDPRANSRVFMSAKGDTLKVEGPFGMEMYPESKEIATDLSGQSQGDLAFLTSLRPQPAIERPLETTRLVLEATGADLSRLPSDAHQTVTRQGDAWRIEVHPPRLADDEAVSIAEAKADQPQWVRPSLHVPADDPAFVALARRVIGGETNVLRAARRVKDHVASLMRPNAGIGVLRDAREVLKTREGVCRDYAILSAAILRAGGIPTRIVTGLVGEGEDLFYHAWVEVWAGKTWLGVDPTRLQTNVSATHVKLSQGNVEEAVVFFLLTEVKLKVIDVKY